MAGKGESVNIRLLLPMLLLWSSTALAAKVPLTVPEFVIMPLAKHEPKATSYTRDVLKQVAVLVKELQYKHALTELTQALSSKQDAALYYTQASVALHLDKPKVAQTALQQALKLVPEFTRAQMMLAWIYTRQHDYQAARPLLQQVIAVKASADSYQLLAYGYLMQQHYLAAQAAYQQALLLTSQPEPILRGLLQAYLAVNANDMALGVLNSLLSMAPQDAELYLVRANLALAQADTDSAINSLSIAMRLSARQDIRWQLAQLYLQQGLYASAQQLMMPLLNQSQLPEPQQLASMLTYMLANGAHQQVSKMVQTLLKREDLAVQFSAQLWAIKGQLAQAKADNKQAINAYRRSLKLEPMQGQVLIRLALLQQQSQPLVAEQLLAKAADIDEVAVQALTLHAQQLLNNKAYQRALTLLNRAYQIDPNSQGLSDNISLVNRLMSMQR